MKAEPEGGGAAARRKPTKNGLWAEGSCRDWGAREDGSLEAAPCPSPEGLLESPRVTLW